MGTISTQGLIAFLVGCIGVRLLFVYLAMVVSKDALKVMAVFAAAIAIGFTVIYVGKLRRTGFETGGRPIWWNSLRPLHAALYGVFAYCAWFGYRRAAWIVLLIDVIIGLLSFVYTHTS
jgi:hypothetical protein